MSTSRSDQELDTSDDIRHEEEGAYSSKRFPFSGGNLSHWELGGRLFAFPWATGHVDMMSYRDTQHGELGIDYVDDTHTTDRIGQLTKRSHMMLFVFKFTPPEGPCLFVEGGEVPRMANVNTDKRRTRPRGWRNETAQKSRQGDKRVPPPERFCVCVFPHNVSVIDWSRNLIKTKVNFSCSLLHSPPISFHWAHVSASHSSLER